MQQEFTENLELALSWMNAIQGRLKANDSTQGPRDALEARLRETERIHQSQHDGRVKMDMALVAAENLLKSGDEEVKNQTHARLKDLKGLWEETSTYIIHCHSRIEWVWLHWSEYLKAYEEFEKWLTRQQCNLDVGVELQLGVKEKLWQVDQQRVVVSDIQSQALLLERLLDEAAALYNRTQDPSVDPQAQERLQEAYNNVRDRAEERLSLLQKIAEEHQTYQGCIQRFQSWLLMKTKDLTDLMEKEDTAEDKLKALQALDDSVANEEKTLLHIETLAEALRGNTSPGGAEMVVDEAEELRLGWQRLRQGLCEAEEGLRASLDTHSQYMARCQRLGEDIRRLRVFMQKLDQDLDKSCEAGECTEDQVMGQWKKYTGVKNALAEEEAQVELIKAQLKELFRFSEDSQHLSDDVLAVVREHQSVKCRATRLCSESETGVRNILQVPLLDHAQWNYMVSKVLASSADVTDFSHIAVMVQEIEHLLKDSVQVQERLSQIQGKADLLDSVFGPEMSDGLQDELGAAIRNRELLHTQLLQRKNRLQGLISRTKDFAEAHEFVVSKLAGLQGQFVAADGLQPDILAKKSQSDQFKEINKDLEDCEAQIMALETLVSSSQTNRTQFEKLYSDWKQLHTAVMLKVRESEESIGNHESFHDSMLNMEKWLMIMKQKLESFHGLDGKWNIEGREHEAERALGEFPEKELQLQQMEVQSQKVLDKTSAEGQVHITRDLKRLGESWTALCNMSLNLYRLLNSSPEVTDSAPLSNESLAGAKKSSAAEVVVDEVDSGTRGASFKIQREKHHDQTVELYGTLPSSGPETGEIQTEEESTGQVMSRWRDFEVWLSRESELLSEILGNKGAALDVKELRLQQDKLQALKRGVAWGQEQFQLLLQESETSEAASESAEDVCLEDLRYRWMLHKSKLKDLTHVRARTKAKKVQAKQEEPAVPAKVQKKPSLLQRVCRLALPLWLLLLALLLLAFLLPLIDEGNSCSLSNNFARSFNIMLRYEGPPPT